MDMISYDTVINSREGNWCFVGKNSWKQDHSGIIYPPSWSHPDFDPVPYPDCPAMPNSYADDLTREDHAFLYPVILGDTDISMDYKCYYGAVTNGGLVFRAIDSMRFYVVDVSPSKGQYYQLQLSVSLSSGYRRQLSSVTIPHSMIPSDTFLGKMQTRNDWNASSPDWVNIRVQATGPYIRVSADGRIVIDITDNTYPAGCTGIFGRGQVCFRSLVLRGREKKLEKKWSRADIEAPAYFVPGTIQPFGTNAYPAVCRAGDGKIWTAWLNLSNECGDPSYSIYVSCSGDDGLTWQTPYKIYDSGDIRYMVVSVFEHMDGRLSVLACVYDKGYRHSIQISSDKKKESWNKPADFKANGKSLEKSMGLWSPTWRFSDGTLITTGYDYRTSKRGPDMGEERIDRSAIFRSSDDGSTWEGPIYIDEKNRHHNECLIIEKEKGVLRAFIWSLASEYLEISDSEDSGLTWSSPVKTNTYGSSGDCPHLFKHSSGALVMFHRGFGSFINISFDMGATWSERFRISPVSAFCSMTETNDGRIMILLHEGYRYPSYIRGQYLIPDPDGPIPC